MALTTLAPDVLFPLPIIRPGRLRPGRFLERHARDDVLVVALAVSEVGGDCLDRDMPALAV